MFYNNKYQIGFPNWLSKSDKLPSNGCSELKMPQIINSSTLKNKSKHLNPNIKLGKDICFLWLKNAMPLIKVLYLQNYSAWLKIKNILHKFF